MGPSSLIFSVGRKLSLFVFSGCSSIVSTAGCSSLGSDFLAFGVFASLTLVTFFSTSSLSSSFFLPFPFFAVFFSTVLRSVLSTIFRSGEISSFSGSISTAFVFLTDLFFLSGVSFSVVFFSSSTGSAIGGSASLISGSACFV